MQQAELDEHLEQEDEEQSNRKNGYTSKLLKTAASITELDISRDRNSNFSAEIVKKEKQWWPIG